MTEQTWAVHSHHSPAVLLIDGGYQITPGATIKAGEPIFTADSFEAAESWRLAKIEEGRR